MKMTLSLKNIFKSELKLNYLVPKTPSLSLLSTFDKELLNHWEDAMKKGTFKYKLGPLDAVIVPGNVGFVAHLNVNRSTMKRKADALTSICQKFNPQKFNFTKITEEEVLMNLNIPSNMGLEALRGTIVINNAPICHGHSLLIPDLEACKNQTADQLGLSLCITLMLLSNTSAFKIGFNSLCAHASVNHGHYHLYYLEYTLPVQLSKSEHLAGACYVLKDYFCDGFVFQLKDGDIQSLVSGVIKLIDLLIREEVPYNINISRGLSLKPDSMDHTIRITVFPRIHSQEIELKCDYFVPACCEFSGHVPVYNAEQWKKLDEEDMVNLMKFATKAHYNKILPKVKKLFS